MNEVHVITAITTIKHEEENYYIKKRKKILYVLVVLHVHTYLFVRRLVKANNKESINLKSIK